MSQGSEAQLEKGHIRTGFEILDAPIQKILWCGDSSKGNRILLTSAGTLYTSQDQGFNWTSLKPTLQATTFVAGGVSTGVVRSIIQNPINPSLLLFQGRKGVSWASNNCGKTVKVLRHGKRAFRFQFHPQFASYLLGGFLPSASAKSGKAKPSALLGLWLSKDWGESWTLLRKEVLDFGWACTNTSQHFDRVIALVKQVKSERYSRAGKLLISPRAQFHAIGDEEEFNSTKPSKFQVVVSDDYFKSEWVISRAANRLVVLPKYVYVTTSTSEGTKLLVADLEAAQSRQINSPPLQLNQTYFPFTPLPQGSFTFVQTASYRICLSIPSPQNVSLSQILCSDSRGHTFTPVISSVLTNPFGFSAFTSLPLPSSVYIVNTAPNESSAEQPQDHTTLFSFDQGQNWSPLPPCSDPATCPRSLSSLESFLSPQLQSSAAAPGLLLSAGKLSPVAGTNQEGVFLSQDAGLSWRLLAPFAALPSFSDQGGLLLLVPSSSPSDWMLFSWDQGHTFTNITVLPSKAYFVRVHTDPDRRGVFFLVEAVLNGKGLVVTLDFSFLMPRQCAAEDFQDWQLTGSRGEQCFLGERLFGLRRNKGANCFVPDKMDMIHQRLPCHCTESESECIPGLAKLGEDCGVVAMRNGRFVIDEDKTKLFLEAPPADCNHSYQIRSPKIQARDSKCFGFANNTSRIELCPSHKLKL